MPVSPVVRGFGTSCAALAGVLLGVRRGLVVGCHGVGDGVGGSGVGRSEALRGRGLRRVGVGSGYIHLSTYYVIGFMWLCDLITRKRLYESITPAKTAQNRVFCILPPFWIVSTPKPVDPAKSRLFQVYALCLHKCPIPCIKPAEAGKILHKTMIYCLSIGFLCDYVTYRLGGASHPVRYRKPIYILTKTRAHFDTVGGAGRGLPCLLSDNLCIIR